MSADSITTPLLQPYEVHPTIPASTGCWEDEEFEMSDDGQSFRIEIRWDAWKGTPLETVYQTFGSCHIDKHDVRIADIMGMPEYLVYPYFAYSENGADLNEFLRIAGGIMSRFPKNGLLNICCGVHAVCRGN